MRGILPAVALVLLSVSSLALFLAFPAQAQGTGAGPELVLAPPSMLDGAPIPLDPDVGELLAPWTFTLKSPADAAAVFGGTNVTLSWSLACTQGTVNLVGLAQTVIPFEAGKSDYKGMAQLQVSAAREAPGEQPLGCTLTAGSSATVDAMEAEASILFDPVAAFRGEILLDSALPSKKAGPDKQVPFLVEVQNLGNARTIVHFALAEAPAGKWDVLLPDMLVLEAGQTDTVVVTVSTAYRTGYVHEGRDLVLTATPSSAYDAQVVGPSQQVTLVATAQGWYVPGPSPMVVLAILAFAAVVARSRR
jgi:hypothetical protein